MTGFAEVLRWMALVMLSCVVPLGIFVGRNNIRAFRREMVRDLERLFSFASLPNGAPLIIPSFELVNTSTIPRQIPSASCSDDPHSFSLLSPACRDLHHPDGARLPHGIHAGCGASAELLCFPDQCSR